MTARRVSRPLSLSYSVAVVRASQLQSDVSDLLPNRISLDMLIASLFRMNLSLVSFSTAGEKKWRGPFLVVSNAVTGNGLEYLCTAWKLTVSWTGLDLDLLASLSTTMNNSRVLSFSCPWVPMSIASDSNNTVKVFGSLASRVRIRRSGYNAAESDEISQSSDILSSMPAGTRNSTTTRG